VTFFFFKNILFLGSWAGGSFFWGGLLMKANSGFMILFVDSFHMLDTNKLISLDVE